MQTTIDAIGKACPMPVIMAKKEIETNHGNFVIIVDNPIAVENLKKLALKMAYRVMVNEGENHFLVSFSTNRPDTMIAQREPELERMVDETGMKVPSWVFFMGKETIGEGNKELGIRLAEMFFYTLTQAVDLPESILLMNAGVKLATLNNQVIGHLKVLKEQGVTILVCGTCLDYYGLSEELAVGEISNMYDITEKLLATSKVVSL
ncbi:sulfurtransferase-like selenium metabolism protein YedF [Acetobacterium wieringae]|uniref:sulfurtransferase-like selenium metabolism protein YedF n=1 Tax=Acetobacterium wieringae TaxID=52694 RepID=UPI003158E6AF